MILIKFDTPKAAVHVKKSPGRKIYNLDFQENGIAVCIVKAGTSFLPLPDDAKILSPDGQIIQPCGRFYISADTIDPYHVVIDV